MIYYCVFFFFFPPPPPPLLTPPDDESVAMHFDFSSAWPIDSPSSPRENFGPLFLPTPAR